MQWENLFNATQEAEKWDEDSQTTFENILLDHSFGDERSNNRLTVKRLLLPAKLFIYLNF